MFWYFFYKQRSCHEEISEKKQSQVQSIQRTVPSRNVTQHNGNINNFWKGSRWFCRQYLRSFCYFLRPEWGLKPLVILFYAVEFVYNGFVCNVNSPITLHFVRSRWHLLHAFQFAYDVISAITFFMQSPRDADIGKFYSYVAC